VCNRLDAVGLDDAHLCMCWCVLTCSKCVSLAKDVWGHGLVGWEVASRAGEQNRPPSHHHHTCTAAGNQKATCSLCPRLHWFPRGL
jgi:hypothetical protein